MLIRTGIDLVDLEPLRRRVDRSSNDLLDAILTEKERADVGDRVDRAGTRWAAKEAVMKALGWGLAKLDPRDIEVLTTPHGPTIALHGAALERSTSLGIQQWSVSLSHTDNYAVASVVAIGEQP